MKDAMLSVTLKKENGKLVHVLSAEQAQYNEFVKLLPEGATVDVFFDLATNDHSRGQQNKVYKCIRILADESGMTFEEMKKEIKTRGGFVLPDGSLKSFGKCSKEELNQAIQTCIEVGDFLNVNLR